MAEDLQPSDDAHGNNPERPTALHLNVNDSWAAASQGTIMLHRAKSLKGYKLDSKDGEIGRVKEFYFDDQHWAIRYMVVDTAAWLPGRQVLISPYALVAAIVVSPSRQPASAAVPLCTATTAVTAARVRGGGSLWRS